MGRDGLLVCMAVGLSLACRPEGATEHGSTTIKLWRHESRDRELSASIDSMKRFTESQDRWRIDYELLPQDSYTESVTAAALADQLPCILDVDQPVVPNFAWTGHLRPLDDLIAESVLESINDGAKGRYQSRVYSVGQFDVALAIFGRASILEANGVRVATIEQPYSADEFIEILRKLKAEDPDRFPVDLNLFQKGEWLAYGFSPWLQSAGADLVDRESFVEAEGVLNSPEAIRVVSWFQTLFDEGLAERQVADNHGFFQGRVVFHYTGSWDAKGYEEKFGDDLLILPPIDFGRGPKIGSGSWQWGISKACEHPQGAAAFVEFILSPREIAAMSDRAGFVPVSDAAAALTERYRKGGEWRLFYEFAKRFAVARPQTPGYPKISSAFEKALLDVRFGKPVVEALDAAVDSIEYDIDRNRGYGFDLSKRKAE